MSKERSTRTNSAGSSPLRDHQLRPIIHSSESRYRWKCVVCQQKWTSKPGSTCLGILTYAFRTERFEYHRTKEELAEEQLQPSDKDLPVAALRFVGSRRWTPLYDRRTAIPLIT